MVVAQLVEQSIPVLEVRGSNPVISKIYNEQLFTIHCIEKKKINKKRPGMAHFFLKKWETSYHYIDAVQGLKPNEVK